MVLFGDETALGLLQALTLARGPLDPLHAVLEAHSAPALRHAADALGLRSVTIIQRTPDESHRSAVEQALLGPLRRFPTRHCVLAGRAQSIQHAARLLRQQHVPSSQISTRAYWSVGKAGLE
jgi:NADPH-dependent ferric siderophore reductase